DRRGRRRVSAPGAGTARGGIRHHRLGYARQRGRRRGAAGRAPEGAPPAGASEAQLTGPLTALDQGHASLNQQLGSAWADTAVLLVTEFGRTAALNGARGTDHGTRSAALLLGGAVMGGRVIADWPGLSARALYQGRDLTPTLDLRSVFKGILA